MRSREEFQEYVMAKARSGFRRQKRLRRVRSIAVTAAVCACVTAASVMTAPRWIGGFFRPGAGKSAPDSTVTLDRPMGDTPGVLDDLMCGGGAPNNGGGAPNNGGGSSIESSERAAQGERIDIALFEGIDTCTLPDSVEIEIPGTQSFSVSGGGPEAVALCRLILTATDDPTGETHASSDAVLVKMDYGLQCVAFQINGGGLILPDGSYWRIEEEVAAQILELLEQMRR